MSTLDEPIWSRYSIALTCPARSHFRCTLSRVRWGKGWDECYRSSREKEKNEETKRGKRREKTSEQF